MKKFLFAILLTMTHLVHGQVSSLTAVSAKTIQSIRVQSVESVAPKVVDFGTDAVALNLPTQLDVTLKNEAVITVDVTWDTGDYDGDIADDYTLFGALDLPGYVSNPQGILPVVVVTVSPEVRTISSVTAIDDITVFTGVDFEDVDLPSTVQVTLDNAATSDLEVTWDNGDYNSATPGTYTIDGAISLSGVITNPGALQAHVDVIVVTPPTVTVTSVASQTPVTVAYNTPFGSVVLPSSVNTTLSNSDVVSINVTWAAGTYDQDAPDTYSITGTLVSLPSGVTNPSNVTATVSVTVLPAGGDEDGIQVKKVIGTGGSPLGYLQYLPGDYSSTSDLYPVFIYLHGAGAKGNGGSTDLDKVSTEQMPKNIKNGWNAVVNGEKLIVLSPQTSQQSELAWLNVAPDWIDWLYTSSGLRFDPDRVYIGGWSMGACGTIKIVASSWNTPNKFAGAISGAHSGGSWSDALALAGKGCPFWFFNGTNDSSVPCCTSGTSCTECYRENTGGRVPYYYDTNGGDLTKEHISSTDDSTIGATATGSIWTVLNLGTHSTTADMAFRVNNNDHTPNAIEWVLTKTKQ